MGIGDFAERQAKRLYPRRMPIAAGGTAAAIAIYVLSKLLRGVAGHPDGLHALRFAFAVLIWSWCVFFLCEWFHPRRGVFAAPKRLHDEIVPESASNLKPIFLGILMLAFSLPFVVWAVLLVMH